MIEIWVKVLIGLIVGGFLAVCYLWQRPLTDFGKISRRLCVLNAIGWAMMVLPWSNQGHPPSLVFVIWIFWLLNFILLPAIGLFLWICRNDQHERKSYVATASIYLALNIIVLYVVPFIGVVIHTIRP